MIVIVNLAVLNIPPYLLILIEGGNVILRKGQKGRKQSMASEPQLTKNQRYILT